MRSQEWRKVLAYADRTHTGAATAVRNTEGFVQVQVRNVAAELARMFYTVREADRMIAYIDNTALPNLDRVLASAVAGMQTGMSRASEVPATRVMVLDMELERLGALRQREDAVTDISLMIAEVTPAEAPLASAETRQ